MSKVFDKIKDLREVPLEKCDFSALREEYGADKHGTHVYAHFLATGTSPSYRLAAQIDLDRYHEGDDTVLNWDDLVKEMFPPADERTNEERAEDQLAMVLDKG